MTARVPDEFGLLADGAARFGTELAGPHRARRLRDGRVGFDADAWRRIVELGWLAVVVPEASGGVDLGVGAACVVARELGAALAMSPLTDALGAAHWLSRCDHRIAVDALDALLDGTAIVALGRVADDHAVVATIPDVGPTTRVALARGTGLAFEVRWLDAGGGHATHADCVDGSRSTRLALSDATWADAPIVAGGVDAEQAWHDAQDIVALCDAAYLCGLAGAALRMALDYLRLRKQFGAPLGSFQALQHRAVDAHVALQSSEALVAEAATATPSARRWAAAAAVLRARETAMRITEECIQFHGAIGFADEHDAGLYLRRAMVVGARHAGALQRLKDARPI